MSKYDVTIKRFALLLLPTFWRRPLLAGLTYAAVSASSYQYTAFTKFRIATDYRLLHNGQTCYLRAMLNDEFDPIDRRITITEEKDNMGLLVVHNRSEEKDRFFPDRATGDALIVNRRGFDGVNGFDFIVNIPIALNGSVDTDRLKALVGIYKLASKRFTINYQ